MLAENDHELSHNDGTWLIFSEVNFVKHCSSATMRLRFDFCEMDCIACYDTFIPPGKKVLFIFPTHQFMTE